LSTALLSKYEELKDKYEGRWFALTRDAKLAAIARAKVKPQIIKASIETTKN